ncbi:hypothetical protein [Methylobacterium sp. CM6247]
MTERPKPPCAVITSPQSAEAAKKRLVEAIEELRRRQGYPPAPPRWVQ